MNTPTRTSSETAAWLQDLAVELRLRDVKGEAIGDAVASVESHLADSGESPSEAFGDPREYAASLEFTPDQYVSTAPADWARALAPVACGVLGLMLTLDALPGVRDGHPLEVTWGRLAALALLVLIVTVAARSLRTMLERPAVSILAFATGVLALGLLPVLWNAVAFTAPAGIALGVAGLLLAASVITAYRQTRSEAADRVTDPVTGTDRYPAPRDVRPAQALAPWVFMLAAVGFGAITWIWGG